ncbi:MAG: aldose 1-epimerase family protein [Bacteroidales bacterium]|nr:aldose 1-epimerase family protein [Bacteroidales bacterium]
MKINNGIISAQIAEHGAELLSIEKNGLEYVWQGDARFWGRHAPILFPTVGKVADGKFTVDGKSYQMGQHGFARDMDFRLVESSSSYACFELVSSEKTLEKYPYPFNLKAEYSAEYNNLIITWTITNPSDKSIFCQIGAHPAFLYKDFKENDPVHGYLSFVDASGKAVSPVCNRGLNGGYAVDCVVKPLGDCLELSASTFDNDALILEGAQVYKTILMDKNKKPYLVVKSATEVLGLWSPVGKNAPFVCIEPWLGRTDKADFKGEFKEREYVYKVGAGKSMEFTYEISILD